MAITPRVITPKPKDLGTAHELSDVKRRIGILEGRYGTQRPTSSVVGPYIGTADPGASGRIYLQSSDIGPPGLYATDTSDNQFLALVPGKGIQLAGFVGISTDPPPPEINCIGWYDGSYLIGELVGSHFTDSSHQQGVISGRAYSPNGTTEARWFTYARNDGQVICGVYAGTFGSPTIVAQLSDETGTGVWNGDLFSPAFNVTSDVKLKDQVQDLTPEIVQAIHSLRPVSYRLIDRGEDTHYGLIAQEVEQVASDLVRLHTVPGGDQKVQSYSLSSLVTLLIAVVQRQERRIKQLEEDANGSSA